MMKFEEDRAAHVAKMNKLEAEMREVFEAKVAEKEAKMKQNEEEVGYFFLLLKKHRIFTLS